MTSFYRFIIGNYVSLILLPLADGFRPRSTTSGLDPTRQGQIPRRVRAHGELHVGEFLLVALPGKVHELGDSSVNFIVRPWVKTDDYWDTYWNLTKAIKLRLDQEGISIPFPQRDVHVIDSKPA